MRYLNAPSSFNPASVILGQLTPSLVRFLFPQIEEVEEIPILVERFQLKLAALDIDVTKVVIDAKLRFEPSRQRAESFELAAAPARGDVDDAVFGAHFAGA